MLEIRAPDPVQIFEKGEGDIATDMVIYEPEELDGEKMVESKEIPPFKFESPRFVGVCAYCPLINQ